MIWWDYVSFCRRWGFARAPAYEFVPWLLSLDGVSLIEGGRGRHRRAIRGMGLRPAEETGR